MTPWKTFVDGLPRHAKPQRSDPIRLVCFDLDGVLLDQESSWVTVHKHFGLHNEEGLYAFLKGEITEEEFIRRDVALWRSKKPDLTLLELEGILARYARLTRGAKSTLRALRSAGVETAIVSSGLEPAARGAAKALGIRHVSANRLETDDRGRLTGNGLVGTPLRDKAVPLRRFAAELGIPLASVASVGNSSPDISMFRASGLAIAFRPTDEFAPRAADVTVPGPSLTGILRAVLGSNAHWRSIQAATQKP